MRLGKIRGRTTEHFHFLLKELVAFAKLTRFSILRTGDTGFLALFDAFFSEPFIERSDVDSKVVRVARVSLAGCDLARSSRRRHGTLWGNDGA